MSLPLSTTRPIDDRFERVADGRYLMQAPDALTEFEVAHLRRERHQLYGELTVRTSLPGAHTTHGVLFMADVNLSTLRGREDIAGSLASRTRAGRDEWLRSVDDLATCIGLAERSGEPAVRLTGQRPPLERHEHFRVLGFSLPQRLPSMIFAAGDSLKTYALDAIAVELDRRGITGLIIDAEMGIDDHQDRIGRLCDGAPPNFLHYMGCSRPLIYELDRIAEVVRQQRIQFLFCDSVGFLVHEKPESAESALKYFQAIRSLGPLGSLHLAHRAKSEDGDKMPFGSAFWFNSVRALWFAQRGEPSADSAVVDVAYLPRKFNVGAFPPPHGLRFDFRDDRTTVAPVSPASVPTLAGSLPLKRRILELLRSGPLDQDAIARALPDEFAETVSRTLRRHAKPDDKQMFVRIADGRFANVDRRHKE